ncbi:hypothetical protein F5050DRAFT_1753282 [Lentinula boryana]|uniref:Uncharacterized protein n=1 Tax=Lentinula boryana TaxID=40481 RepID=A0ABQ8QFI8_9AGAR|nr:hypothetical protein F5050DRAFT_1753282 [Lentinula boryana]
MLRILAKQPLRTISTSTRRCNQKSPEPDDFRPAWLYTFARVASNISIFGIMTYAVFFYDFGNDEHVFQPVRRWVSRQKSTLFALSPDEEKFVESEKRKAEAGGSPKSHS